MKHLVTVILSAAVLAAAACSKPETEPRPTPVAATLSITPVSLSVSAAGSVEDVAVTSNSEWKVSVPADASWIIINPLKGKNNAHLSVTVMPNGSEFSREASISISVEGKTETLKLSQAAYEAPAPQDPPKPYAYPEDPRTIETVACMFYGTATGENTKMDGPYNCEFIGKDGVRFIDFAEYPVALPGATVQCPGAASCWLGASSLTSYYSTFVVFSGLKTKNIPVIFTIPATQKIFGDLDFTTDINQAGGAISGMEFSWSADGGNTWRPFSALYSNLQPDASGAGKTSSPINDKTVNSGWFVAEFSIPEAEAIPVGGSLMVKAQPTYSDKMSDSSTMRVNGGFILSNRSHNPGIKGDNVVAYRDFEESRFGINTITGKSSRYMLYICGGRAEAASDVADAFGWTPVGLFSLRRGYAFTITKGAAAHYLSPALSSLSKETDICVTFKCCTYVPATKEIELNALRVSVDGPGEVGELVFDTPLIPEGATYLSPELYEWHVAHAMIKGATSATRVKIGVLSKPSSSARYFIDDIVITK